MLITALRSADGSSDCGFLVNLDLSPLPSSILTAGPALPGRPFSPG